MFWMLKQISGSSRRDVNLRCLQEPLLTAGTFAVTSLKEGNHYDHRTKPNHATKLKAEPKLSA